MKTTEQGYSRGAFLNLAAAGAAGAGVVGWLRFTGSERVVVCSKCAAEFAEGHHYKAGPVRGVYCPNCGVELTRLEYDLRQDAMFEDGDKAQSEEARRKWNYGQVPFPNPKLVSRTDKPAIVLSEIKI